MEEKKKRLLWFENIIKYDKERRIFNIIDFDKERHSSTCFVPISIFDDKSRGTISEDYNKVQDLLKILMKPVSTEKDKKEKDLKEKKENIKKLNFENIELRSIGSILGMAIGDAMGSRLEFQHFIYEDEYEKLKEKYNIPYLEDMGTNPGGHFKLEPGQWTDDTSMGLCLADSLLVNDGKLDKYDLMNRFIAWWIGGYNNAFRLLEKPRRSVGLGGNISLSLHQYLKDPVEETNAGNKNTSGNGSIMRNAAIPICFNYDIKKACEKAKEQSLTTHQGIQAKECCNILTNIVVKILKEEDYEKNEKTNKKDYEKVDVKPILENLKKDELLDVKRNPDYKQFSSIYDNVTNLINHEKNSQENWNWKDGIYKYNKQRANSQPGYIGSYAMDNLAMSLNIVYRTKSFEDAIKKAVNLRGDSDSVASVVGQIAGAAYPIYEIPFNWIKAIYDWDEGEIALRGYMLSRLNLGSSYFKKKEKTTDNNKNK